MNNTFASFNQQPPFGNGTFDSSNQFAPSFDTNGTLKPSHIDPSKFTNPQLHHQQSQSQQSRMTDAADRTQSPGFQTPSYQTNQLIPAKRARPGEDASNMSSPRAPPGGISTNSRSQTPQQPQPQPPMTATSPFPGQSFPNVNSMGHLQHPGSTHASPSPGVQNHFRPPGPGQPQSGMQQGPPGQQFQNVSRAGSGTPLTMNGAGSPGTPSTIQGYPAPGQFIPNQSGPGASPTNPSLGPDMHNPHQMYRQRLQQQQQQMQAANMQGARPGVASQSGKQPQSQSPQKSNPSQLPGQQPGGLMPGMRGAADHQSRQFISFYQSFCRSKNFNLNPNPLVCGKPIDYYMLFCIITGLGIMQTGPNKDNWTAVAERMQMPASQFPTAPQELKAVFEQNHLADFMLVWMQAMARKKVQNNLQKDNGPNMGPSTPRQASPISNSFPAGISQMTPQHPHATPQPQQIPQQIPQAANSNELHTSAQNQTPVSRNAPLPGMNGVQNHAQNTPPANQRPGQAPSRQSSQASLTNNAQNLGEDKIKSSPSVKMQRDELGYNVPGDPGPEYTPTRVRPEQTWGGIELHNMINIGERTELVREDAYADEIGTADLHALSMSLQCGIDSEVRYALDQLVMLTSDHPSIRMRSYKRIALADCEDLVESLVQCADEELAALSELDHPASGNFRLPSFEDVRRWTIAHTEQVQSVFKFADESYETVKHLERIDAVTIVLRNLSESEPRDMRRRSNRQILASPQIVTWFCDMIKYLGTRTKFLQTYHQTLDIIKDLVHFLANIAADVELTNEDDAFLILQFLLMFAPPVTSNMDRGHIIFESPDAYFHTYLPSAIEALAKILARDEPNRPFFRSIFASESPESGPHTMLTKAFALAISPIPDFSKGFFSRSRLRPVVNGMHGMPGMLEADARIIQNRKPFFSLGMLAADILAGLAPGAEDPLAKSWLESDDGWAAGLIRMVLVLSDHEALVAANPQGHPQSRGHLVRDDERGFGLITQRALSMLLRLVEKSDLSSGGERDGKKTATEILPIDDMLLDILKSETFDKDSLRKVLALAKMD